MLRRDLLLGAALVAGGFAWAAQAEEPIRGGTLAYAAGTDVQTWDPQMIGDVPTARMVMHVYDSLLVLDPEGHVRPNLATEWSISPDKLTWTFKLRPDVRFDDGTPFTAEAVRFTYDRMRDPATGSPRRSVLNFLDHVQVIDDHTVALVTKQPFAPLLSLVSGYNLAILNPAHAAKVGAGLRDHPSGTGPFRLKSWQRGEKLTLVRSDGYWGEAPFLDAVEQRVVPEDSARTLLLMSGQADVVGGIPTVLLPRLQAAPNLHVLKKKGVRTLYVGMNMAMKPFDDLRVRQAVAQAIDVRALLSGVLGGLGQLGGGLESPAIEGAVDLPPYAHDPAAAKRLLAEAGHPDGFETSFYVPTGRYTQDRQLGQAIQAQLAEVGIKASIQSPEFGAFLAALNARDKAPMFLLGKGSPTADLDFTMGITVASSGSGNYSNLKLPELDKLIAAQRAELDRDKRDAILKQAQELVYQAVPVVPIVYEEQVFATRAVVHDVRISTNEFVSFAHAWKA